VQKYLYFFDKQVLPKNIFDDLGFGVSRNVLPLEHYFGFAIKIFVNNSLVELSIFWGIALSNTRSLIYK
jgi:hypothetical protein